MIEDNILWNKLNAPSLRLSNKLVNIFYKKIEAVHYPKMALKIKKTLPPSYHLKVAQNFEIF